MNTKLKIQEYLRELSPKSILDLGCGKGRILKLFSDKNCKITAVDKIDMNEILPSSVKFIQEDLRNFNIEGYFDLTIMSMVLHFLRNDEALKIIKNVKDNTSPGNYNFILCMSSKEIGKRESHFYPSLPELKKFYESWEIKSEEFETDLEEHDGLPLHNHNLIIFLARKSP